MLIANDGKKSDLGGNRAHEVNHLPVRRCLYNDLILDPVPSDLFHDRHGIVPKLVNIDVSPPFEMLKGIVKKWDRLNRFGTVKIDIP